MAAVLFDVVLLRHIHTIIAPEFLSIYVHKEVIDGNHGTYKTIGEFVVFCTNADQLVPVGCWYNKR